jgi:hypothetical protein
MVKLVDPKIGETIYDGAVGSAGFLCEAFEYIGACAKICKPTLPDSSSSAMSGKPFCSNINIVVFAY